MNGVKPYKALFSRKLAITSAVILLIFCVVVAIQAVATHETAFNQGKKITQRLTKIQSDHIELTFGEVNLTLKAQALHYYYNSLFNHPVVEDMQNGLEKWVHNTPTVAWVIVTDDFGKLQTVVSKKSYEQYSKKIATLENEKFFQELKSKPFKSLGDTEFRISKLAIVGGKEMIVISQPIFKYDGSFAGVVSAFIDADYFFSFFNTIEVGKNISLAIVFQNNSLVFSGNKINDKNNILNEYLKTWHKNSQENHVSVYDDKTDCYFVSSKKIDTLNAHVILALNKDEILSGWRSDRITDLIFLMLFALFGGVLLSLVLAMSKQIQKSEESEKAALLANQAKSEFLAKMSHELRTPLNAIIGFSEMIENGYFGPLNNSRQQERMHDINLCGTHLLQLINDILDYTKGEAGKLEIHESECYLANIVEESIKMLREKAKRKNIAINANIPEDLPNVLGDERKMKQIIINLLSNAAKFTPNGGDVTVEAFINKKGDVEVIVKDTGIGIPAEEIPNALSVFGQVRGRHMIEEEGTGLGLPLCKMLAELHGGVFFLESEVGVGTTAGFTIPHARIITKKTVAKKS